MKIPSFADPSILFIAILSAYVLTAPFSNAIQAAIIISVCLILILSEATRNLKVGKYLCLTFIVAIYIILQFGYNISIRDTGVDTYIAVLQSFGFEAFWYSAAYGDISERITVIFFVSAIFVFADRYFHQALNLIRTRSVPLTGAALAVILVSPGLFSSLTGEAQKLNTAMSQLRKEREVFVKQAPSFQLPSLARTSIRNLSIVTLIGESTSKWNVSLYGYPRKTFGALDDVSNLLVFDDVVSPHTHTVQSLMRALTSDEFIPDVNLIAGGQAPVSLISALNSAGIQTLWYSNQNKYGIWDNPVSYQGLLSSQSYFHRKTIGTIIGGLYFDGDLVNIAIDRLKTLPHRSAMFFHFYASHIPYCGVIPEPLDWGHDIVGALPDKAIFGRYRADRKLVDCYDSAVHYAAENIKRVIDWIDTEDYPIILLYFSDHGEDVFTGLGHDSSKFTHKMAQVPMLMHFNQAAIRTYPQLFETLKANKSSSIDLENIYDLILDLFNIKFIGYSVSERSIASKTYTDRNRYILDRGKQGYISFDSVPQAERVPPDIADRYVAQRRQINALPDTLQEKICAHRNNSLLKFMEAMSIFSCLEVDVILDESINAAMVHHDADDPNGLPLDVILNLAGADTKRIWLDVKNLSDNNVYMLLNVLRKFKRSKDNTLVEVSSSAAGSRGVDMLLESGYFVSYYLPTELGVKCSKVDTIECTNFASKVERDLQSGFSGLSFDIAASSFVSKLKIPANISISTWDLDTRPDQLGRKGEDIKKYNMYIIPYTSDFSF